jgi:Tfp pilus assembly protein PilX
MSRCKTAFMARHANSQAGIALLLCLLFLTAMALTGLNASADAILQNQLAANLKAQQQAEQAANDALDWAENWLRALELPAPASYSELQQPSYLSTLTDLPENVEQASIAWWRENAYQAGSYPENADKTPASSHYQAGQSLWMVIPVHWQPPAFDGSRGSRAWYRIVARGSQAETINVSIVESLFVRTWPSDEQLTTAGINNETWCVAKPGDCGRRAWRKMR